MSAVIVDFPAPVQLGAVLTRQEAMANLPKAYLSKLAAEVRADIGVVDAALTLHDAGLSHELGPELRGIAVSELREMRALMQDLLDDLI